MLQTGQCPNCYAINALTTRDCIECRQLLPWGPTVDAQAAAARQAEEEAKQKAAVIAHAAQQSAQARAKIASRNIPNTPPGQALPVNVFEVYADSFVGRFSTALEYMDKNSAIFFSLICMVVYNVCIVAGVFLITKNLTDSLAAFFPAMRGPITPPTLTPPALTPEIVPSAPATASNLTATQIFKLLVIAMTPWVTIAISCTAARKLFGGEERHIEGDIFIAGVCLLPTGFLVLAAGLLGFSNYSAIAALAVFAFSYTILLIYRGLTTVSRIRDMPAALCVPLVLLLSSYLTRVVFSRLVESSF